MPKWIEFELLEKKLDRKTDSWVVKNKEYSSRIGIIKWHRPWRTYAFYPENATIFEDDCLRDIAQFIEDRMKEGKNENYKNICLT